MKTIEIGDTVIIKHSNKTGIVSNVGTDVNNVVNCFVVSYSNGSCFTSPENLNLISKKHE